MITYNIASNVRVPGHAGSALSNGTNTTQNGLSCHYNECGQDVTALQLIYSGWRMDTTSETDNANDYTVTAGIEYPVGTNIGQVTWSGSTSKLITAGSNIISDSCSLSATIPADAKFGVRTFVSVTAGQTWPTSSSMASSIGELGEHGVGLADKSISGTITGTTACLRPSAILATGTGFGSISLAGIGDSIAAGAGDGNFDTHGNTSFMGRAATGNCPFIAAAVSGTRLANQVLANKMDRRLDLFQKAGITHVLTNYGVNDVTALIAASTIEANLVTFWSLFDALGIVVIQSTITPVTASTESWLTESSQTITNGGMTGGASSVRSVVNDYIRSLPSPLLHYFEAADVVETSRDSGIWKATSASSSYLSAKDSWVDAGGSSTTVIQAVNNKGIDYYRFGGGIKFTSGANSGVFRTVSASTNTTITVGSAFSSSPSAADTLDAWPVSCAMTSDGTHPRYSGTNLGAVPAMRDALITDIASWPSYPATLPDIDPGACYLLYEDEFHILLESGDGYLLVQNCTDPVPPSPPGPKPLYGGGGYYSWSMHYENQMANKLKMALDKKRGQLAVLLKNKEIYSNGFQTRENKYKLLAINTKLIKVNKEIKSLTKQLENL